MSSNVQNLASSALPATDLKDPIYVRLRDLVYQTCGIYHPEEKLYLLAGACNRRMATAKVRTAQCCASTKDGEEWRFRDRRSVHDIRDAT